VHGEEHPVGAGGVVVFRRGGAHAFMCISETGRILGIQTPALFSFHLDAVQGLDSDRGARDAPVWRCTPLSTNRLAALLASPPVSEAPTFSVGSFHLQSSYVRPRRFPYLYRHAADEVALAERRGFDAAWIGQHHFAYDGFSPATLPDLANLAGATERIALGAGIILYSLHTAREIAAQCAAFHDAFPGRRLRLACAAGYSLKDFDAHEIDFKRRGAVLSEQLKALTTEHADELGDTEIWMGGVSEAALRRAGRFGASLMLPPGFTPEGVRAVREIWGETLVPGKHPPRVAAQCDFHVVDDPATRRWLESRVVESWKTYPFYGSWDGSDVDEETFVANCTQLSVFDSSAAIVERAGELAEAGCDEIYIRVRFDGTPKGAAMEQIERVAAEVLPQLTDVEAVA
jgi:alkanesulfonate monooxygenase SsuD/methylene tetrahydromethanopterin reductase-like flavin-dependent oxidoreductase (luciferase family)